MVEVRWTPQAADDLESIAEYIARDSPHYASLFASDLLTKVEELSIFPARGRVVPETRKDDIREVFFGNYRIIYRVKETAVEVLTIYHGSRILDPNRLN